MKVAKLYTGKKGFISMLKGFHGKTLGSLSLMGKYVFRKPLLPLLDGIRQVPFADLKALEHELSSARAVGDDIAAVVLEPIQGEAGAIVPPDEYLPGVRALCDHYGVLLIADEVQTGFGRTGEIFGVDHWDVKPDIMCFGKALGGGVVPMSAFMATPEIWKCLEPNPFMHTTTTGGNPLACASALAAISVLLEEDLAAQAKKKGKYVLEKLGELQDRYPGILAKKRGLGLLLGMEFHTDGIGYKVASGLFSRGVITAGTLTNAKNIRYEPALNIPWKLLDESLNRIEDVFKSIELPKGKPNEFMYAGHMLHVDLSRNDIQSKTIPKEIREQYIGGWGIATKYLYDTVDPKIDPLSADNALVIMTGPVCGTLVPTSARTCLVSKSPKTGTIFETNIGGSFGPELKFAGFDGIVITGKAKKPVYLRIENNRVTLEDASALVGKGIFETEEWLKDEVDVEAKTLSIGPAGENLVEFACIGSESYRQMGRGGAGTLFGSKNLKAVVCRGTGGVQVNEIGSFYEKVVEHTENSLLTDENMWAKNQGTPILVDVTNEMGIHPTRNFTKGVSAGRQNLNADAIDDVKIGDRSCASCPMGCGKFTEINGTRLEGPEYETLCLGGSNCEISDLETVMKFNRVCDDYGIDTMSCGNIIGLAMDLTESGIHDYGIKFGNGDEMLSLVKEIATQSTPRGRDLALGAQKLAAKYHADDKAAYSKNLEMPAYDPRGNYGMALGFATSERGACHLRSFTIFEDEPFNIKLMSRAVMDKQNLNAVKFSVGLCDFWGNVDTIIMADFLTKGLGKKVSARDLDKAGERIWNLNRLFNLKAGFKSSDDVISSKLLNKVLENGPHEGRKFDIDALEQMKSLLYSLRGWDENGIPSEDKLSELDLLDA